MGSLAVTTWTDAASLTERVLLVPVGATEQHGRHLPLTTDTDIACAIVSGVRAELPGHVVVAPAVSFGASDEHADFAGTLSVGHEAIETYLLALCRSAARTWRRVLLVSTHGGNDRVVLRVSRTARRDGLDVRAWRPRWDGDAHAGRLETSLMLAIARSAVRLADAEPGETAPLVELMPRLVSAGVRAVSDNGVLGDPTGASAAEGRLLLDTAVASVRAVLTAWPAEVPA